METISFYFDSIKLNFHNYWKFFIFRISLDDKKRKHTESVLPISSYKKTNKTYVVL